MTIKVSKNERIKATVTRAAAGIFVWLESKNCNAHITRYRPNPPLLDWDEKSASGIDWGGTVRGGKGRETKEFLFVLAYATRIATRLNDPNPDNLTDKQILAP